MIGLISFIIGIEELGLSSNRMPFWTLLKIQKMYFMTLTWLKSSKFLIYTPNNWKKIVLRQRRFYKKWYKFPNLWMRITIWRQAHRNLLMKLKIMLIRALLRHRQKTVSSVKTTTKDNIIKTNMYRLSSIHSSKNNLISTQLFSIKIAR